MSGLYITFESSWKILSPCLGINACYLWTGKHGSRVRPLNLISIMPCFARLETCSEKISMIIGTSFCDIAYCSLQSRILCSIHLLPELYLVLDFLSRGSVFYLSFSLVQLYYHAWPSGFHHQLFICSGLNPVCSVKFDPYENWMYIGFGLIFLMFHHMPLSWLFWHLWSHSLIHLVSR